MRLSLDVAARATDARVIGSRNLPDGMRIRTDTRTLERGDAFLALRGERFDGHDFLAQAVEKGASALIVESEVFGAAPIPTLIVANTLRAYMELAAAARARYSGTVVAITGSVGKTTTKSLLAQLLTAAGRSVLAAPENENNEIGVSKLLLEIATEDVVVVEMGARKYGDIAALVEIARPEIGVLTNIGEAHVEIMGSRERLEETKWALFSGGARAVLNLSDAASNRRSASLPREPGWFYSGEGEAASPGGWLCEIVGTGRMLIVEAARTREYRIDVGLPGAYNRTNLAAALAAAYELSCFESEDEREAILRAIPLLALPHGRFESIVLERGPRLIYDAYNANASGMIAALEAFAQERAVRRVAVLASMAELGPESEELHERVGEAAAKRVDWLLVGGEFAPSLARGAQRGGLPAGRIIGFASNGDAAAWLREHAHSDDLVLLKGSRKYRLEEIVGLLR
jgi:UDP-N-acetylmuramoyl-tripeptide--D-alanyl-D-alanine ligase